MRTVDEIEDTRVEEIVARCGKLSSVELPDRDSPHADANPASRGLLDFPFDHHVVRSKTKGEGVRQGNSLHGEIDRLSRIEPFSYPFSDGGLALKSPAHRRGAGHLKDAFIGPTAHDGIDILSRHQTAEVRLRPLLQQDRSQHRSSPS